MTKSRVYWFFQFAGWLFFIGINYFALTLKRIATQEDQIYQLSLIPAAIGLTHIYRYFIIRQKWLQKAVMNQLMIAILVGYLLAVIFLGLSFLLNLFIFGEAENLSLIDIGIAVIFFWFAFFLWGLIYYFYHHLRTIRKIEIQQLKMKATLKEAELNKLKSQLNPHFMFNALNSIRALIGEDPKKAKDAVTKLSSLLRQTLTLEKNKVIPFDNEIQLVKDYLGLEQIRFEERLEFSFDLDPNSSKYQLPPMLLQTLVENAIKHGISHLPEGGIILVKSKLQNSKKLLIEISNSGKYLPEETLTSGYGIKNTKDRLNYVFADRANFAIFNEKFLVKCQIVIPLYKI